MNIMMRLVRLLYSGLVLTCRVGALSSVDSPPMLQVTSPRTSSVDSPPMLQVSYVERRPSPTNVGLLRRSQLSAAGEAEPVSAERIHAVPSHSRKNYLPHDVGTGAPPDRWGVAPQSFSRRFAAGTPPVPPNTESPVVSNAASPSEDEEGAAPVTQLRPGGNYFSSQEQERAFKEAEATKRERATIAPPPAREYDSRQYRGAPASGVVRPNDVVGARLADANYEGSDPRQSVPACNPGARDPRQQNYSDPLHVDPNFPISKKTSRSSTSPLGDRQPEPSYRWGTDEKGFDVLVQHQVGGRCQLQTVGTTENCEGPRTPTREDEAVLSATRRREDVRFVSSLLWQNKG